jgi:hypothetical protein
MSSSVEYSIIMMKEYATETPLDFSGWLHVYDSLPASTETKDSSDNIASTEEPIAKESLL